MKIAFHKYHGTGNDFIIIDNRNGKFPASPGLIAALCHRRFGIGADGLILLNQDAACDFGMQYFNADGLESTMCGNGGRCITAFADFLSLPGPEFHFNAIDGQHTGIVTATGESSKTIMLSMTNVDGMVSRGSDFILDTGSPHLVRFVENVWDTDVVKEGRIIRHDPEFAPGGINVNYASANAGSLLVRTYERGVEDETLSCGTGVTASALAHAYRLGLDNGSIPVITPGGSLKVHFKRTSDRFTEIFLEGPAVRIFSGETDYITLPENGEPLIISTL